VLAESVARVEEGQADPYTRWAIRELHIVFAGEIRTSERHRVIAELKRPTGYYNDEVTPLLF
jgi:hypothetical protein